MCGIAGILGRCDEPAVLRMTDAQRHRGPDDQGVWIDAQARCSLGHRRLAIIDLSADGHQPMTSADGRLTIVFNGEIYNYRDLRAELEARGRPFRTHSDTEVLLVAYAEWGAASLARLRGMFAFALVDRHPPAGAPSALLARDRLGIKPLLYAERAGTLMFASELRAMLAGGLVPPELDPEGLLHFFLFGSVLQPRTILRDVQALPPGHTLEWTEGRGRLRRYWDLHENTGARREELAGVTEAEAARLVGAKLDEATRYHLIADVPVGSFLSGGMDSAVVTGLMARATGQPVHTFSAGFSSRHRALDERRYARETAALLGTVHREVVLGDGDALSLFEGTAAALDQPSVDGMNTWAISRAARSAVTVALSGLGGDELFAGYGHFDLIAKLGTRRDHGRARRLALWKALGTWSPFLNRRLGPLVLAAAPAARRVGLVRQLCAAGELERAWPDFDPRRVEAVWASTYDRWLPVDGDPVQRTTYSEVNGYLLSTLLRDVDATSMAHALEVRPVLLDHELVELVYALPARVKLRPGRYKPLLFDSAAHGLPPAVGNRPKRGFALPYREWMASRPLRDRLLQLLETEHARALFTPAYRAASERALRAGSPTYPLWAWGLLLAWLEKGPFQPTPADARSIVG